MKRAWIEKIEEIGTMERGKEEEFLSRIVMSPGVYDGIPTVRDSEAPVELVLHLLGQGQSESEVRVLLSLSKEDIQAVFYYAYCLVAKESILPDFQKKMSFVPFSNGFNTFSHDRSSNIGDVQKDPVFKRAD